VDESRIALVRARRALEESARPAPEVAALVAKLRAIREENHFSERVVAMLRAEGDRG
jgi:hypothetical protein